MCVCALPGNVRGGSEGGGGGEVVVYICAHTHSTVVCGIGESSTEKFQGGTLSGN